MRRSKVSLGTSSKALSDGAKKVKGPFPAEARESSIKYQYSQMTAFISSYLSHISSLWYIQDIFVSPLPPLFRMRFHRFLILPIRAQMNDLFYLSYTGLYLVSINIRTLKITFPGNLKMKYFVHVPFSISSRFTFSIASVSFLNTGHSFRHLAIVPHGGSRRPSTLNKTPFVAFVSGRTTGTPDAVITFKTQ